MNNRIIPTGEIAIVKEIINLTDDLRKYHYSHEPNKEFADDILNRIHTVMFLDSLKDLIKSVALLENLVTVSREDFKDLIEEHGGTLEEFEKTLLVSEILEKLDK